MQILKVCFVGIGSIAKRHIKNLSSICEKINISLRIDAYRQKNAKSPLDGVCNVYKDINEVPSDYDIIFVTNPTNMHLDSLKAFEEKGKNFFIEKPVVSCSQIELAEQYKIKSDGVFYVAGPLKFNAVIQYIKDKIDSEDIISVRSISSSYLPDWRPGVDYRETYSAHKSMGGGVSIDLIHEWDYLTYLFGFPQNLMYMKGKKSDLEIDSDDYAIYMAEYKDKIIELHLDYFGKNTIREIELITKKGTIIGDIVNNRIVFLDSGKVVDFKEERDDFQKRELEYFLNMVNEKKSFNGFNEALKVLKLTQGLLNN